MRRCDLCRSSFIFARRFRFLIVRGHLLRDFAKKGAENEGAPGLDSVTVSLALFSISVGTLNDDDSAPHLLNK